MNRRNKIIAVAGVIAAGIVSVAGCSSSSGTSGQTAEQNASNNIEKTYLTNQPPPVFSHSDLRATGTAIEAIQALGEQTTSFAISNNGQLLWSCPSLGEPWHATDSITNPVQPYNSGYPQGGAVVTIGNMDPNGVYGGQSSGTYVLCVDKFGNQYSHYAEELVDVISGPATWDPNLNGPGKGGPVLTGAPTMPKCTYTPPQGGHKAKTVCVK